MKYKLGFIGAGNMAEAVAKAYLLGAVRSPPESARCDAAPQRPPLLFAKGILLSDLV